MKVRHIPRLVVFGTGIYTIGNLFYDQTYATITQKLIERQPFNFQQRYGENTFAVIAGATSPTG